MARLFFITHPEVDIDPAAPVPAWRLSAAGRARMSAYAGDHEPAAARIVWSSAERKAEEGADILATSLGVERCVDAALGETDRSSTGYVAPPEFWTLVEAFFAQPEESVRGWERAVDAQARIVEAVRRAAADSPAGDIAIVAHGGVGALLLAWSLKRPISRAFDQPFQGHRLVLDRATLDLIESWRALPPIEALAGAVA